MAVEATVLTYRAVSGLTILPDVIGRRRLA